MKARFFIAALLGLMIAVGCGPGNPMVGTWKLEMSEALKQFSKGQEGNVTMTFNDDKTVTMSGGAAGKTESASGTYTLEENKLTIKMTSPSGSPDQTFTLSEDKKSFEMPIIGKMVKQ